MHRVPRIADAILACMLDKIEGDAVHAPWCLPFQFIDADESGGEGVRPLRHYPTLRAKAAQRRPVATRR